MSWAERTEGGKVYGGISGEIGRSGGFVFATFERRTWGRESYVRVKRVCGEIRTSGSLDGGYMGMWGDYCEFWGRW